MTKERATLHDERLLNKRCFSSPWVGAPGPCPLGKKSCTRSSRVQRPHKDWLMEGCYSARKDLRATIPAFSLPLLTERPHATWLFLRKSRARRSVLQSRSENASCVLPRVLLFRLRWLKSSEQHEQMSIVGVLRLRAAQRRGTRSICEALRSR
jgi:hypothetical protein